MLRRGLRQTVDFGEGGSFGVSGFVLCICGFIQI